nr:ABC transporter permease [Bacillota bacterium]
RSLFAQLSGSNRGARGYAITLLVIAYLMRGIGDVTVEALSWISPLGWVTKAQVYAHNDWWPVCLMFLGSAIGFAGAYYLHSIRDLGAGFLNERPGRKQASPLLRTPIGLAWRLQRTGTIAWGIGMLLIGLSYGSVLGELESFFQENEMMKQFLAEAPGVSLTEQFISKIITVMAILATVPPVMAMNKLYGEEKRNRIEPVLGRAVSRTRLMTSYGLLSAGNGFVMLSLAAIGLWAAGTAAMEGKLAFGMVYSAAIAFYPALLVMIGTSAMLIGLLPKWNALVWLYLFYSFIVVYLGGLFQFPEWVAQISPFGHIPQLPVEEMDVSKVWLLTAVAILLATVGWMGYKRRDLHG